MITFKQFKENELLNHNYVYDNDLDHELTKHYQHVSNNFHIQSYTNDSLRVNNHLWKKYKNNKPEKNFIRNKNDSDQLNAVLNVNKTPKAFHVYSGTRYDPTKKLSKDKILHHPAFLSTSIASDRAKDFGSTFKNKEEHIHVMKIKVPKGHPGVYEGNNGEQEFILPSGINLKHKNTEKNTIDHGKPEEGKLNKTHYYLHHMEIVK